MFINSTDMLQPFFSGKKAYRQTSFYIEQRKKWQLLMEKNDKPLGGKWTYDDQNRMKYPNSKSVPEIS